MKKLIPILLLCALLLFGCAKKETAPEGSGSAGTETGQTAEKKDQPASKSENSFYTVKEFLWIWIMMKTV